LSSWSGFDINWWIGFKRVEHHKADRPQTAGVFVMGGAVLTPEFYTMKNSVFATPGGMATAAATVVASMPRDHLQYDNFTRKVIPHRGIWPTVTSPKGNTISSYDMHKRMIDLVRADLARAPNTEAVAPDEPGNIPKWRLELLDQVFQKLYYSNPPIPYDTCRADSTNTAFQIKLVWDLDSAGKPAMLHLTILCPQGTPAEHFDAM
jgi:hypothetical protein